ncbi:MAG: hypothetical protein ABI597_06280 [Gammaproteobacteria bacterium]
MSFRREKSSYTHESNEIKQESHTLSHELLIQANTLQLKVLGSLLAIFYNELRSDYKIIKFEFDKEIQAEKVKIVNFIFERMTCFQDTKGINPFLDEFITLSKNKNPTALSRFLQEFARPLKNLYDVELFINAYKRCKFRNLLKDRSPNRAKSTLTKFFSKYLADVEVLRKKLPAIKHGKLAIVVLNKQRAHKFYSRYFSLSAKDQIDNLFFSIEKACEELAVKAPDSTWIITACEYVIDKQLDNKLKKYFKNGLANIIQKFPKLIIIPGTISSEHRYDLTQDKSKLLAKLKKMDDSYDTLMKTNGYIYSATLARHTKETLRKIQNNRIDPRIGSEYKIYSNNCYRIQNSNMSHIQKFKKTNTLAMDAHNTEPFLCEAGTESHFFKFEELEVGVEVCADHATAIVLEEGRNRIRPLIHFLLSDYVSVLAERIFGDLFVQANTRTYPRLIVNHPDAQSQPVHLYQMDILDRDSHLKGPFEPLYPFEFRVNDKLNETIVRLAETSWERELLEDFSNRFKSENIKSITEDKAPPYDWLETQLVLLVQPRKSFFGLFFNSEVSSEIKILVNDLKEMLKAHRAAYPSSYDTMPQQDAPLMKVS